MITYKIYPLPGMCDKTITGSMDPGDAGTLGELLSAITEKDGVDFSAGVPFLALLNSKPVDLLKTPDRIIEDGSELLVLPVIMGG